MGIEPTSEAWEASILPLYDARPDNFHSSRIRGAGTTVSFTKKKDAAGGCRGESLYAKR